MNLHEFLSSPAESSQRAGAHDRIVLSSRVRLARNLNGWHFPGWAKKGDRVKALDAIRPAVEALPQMRGYLDALGFKWVTGSQGVWTREVKAA